jgi:hypothetical protein
VKVSREFAYEHDPEARKLTARPELAVADKRWGLAPKVTLLRAAIVMVWV